VVWCGVEVVLVVVCTHLVIIVRQPHTDRRYVFNASVRYSATSLEIENSERESDGNELSMSTGK
jgi:hypothetical protein